MTAKWGSCITLALCAAFLAGCKTPQPELKPAKTAEQFVAPPPDARYDSAAYPKQAFDKMEDPGLKLMDAKNGMPARSGGMPSAGMGGR
jgi:hypothetical protein